MIPRLRELAFFWWNGQKDRWEFWAEGCLVSWLRGEAAMDPQARQMWANRVRGYE